MFRAFLILKSEPFAKDKIWRTERNFETTIAGCSGNRGDLPHAVTQPTFAKVIYKVGIDQTKMQEYTRLN